jgi:hypothetical protein
LVNLIKKQGGAYMSMQIISHTSSTTQSLQAIPNYNFVPPITKLDPITSKITKTYDAALAVMHQIESRAVARFWEGQKKQPSATWLGDLMDWFLGWGKHHPENKPKEEITSEMVKRAMLKDYRCPNSSGAIVHDYLNTSYDVQTYPNQNCIQLNQELYWTEFFQLIWKPVGSEDPICRIADCIKESLKACYPICLPCRNATDEEKNNLLNYTSDLLWFKSTFDEDLGWVYLVETNYHSPNRSNLNLWKLTQIYKLFNTTRLACENQILHPPAANPELQGLYSLLIIPVAVVGGVIIVVCKHKKAAPSYEPLNSAVSSV